MSQLSKLINYKYQEQPADLISAKPTGPIEGYHKNYDSNNQSWYVVVVGGNNLTIQNGSTKTYAAPENESEGAKIVGSPNPYVWQQNPVSGGWYQLATTDCRYAWKLTGDQDYAPIVLVDSQYEGPDAQWGYEPTAPVGN